MALINDTTEDNGVNNDGVNLTEDELSDSLTQDNYDVDVIGLGSFGRRNKVNAVFQQLLEKIEENLKLNNDHNIQVVGLDKDIYELGYSLILFTRKINGNVYYYIAILEATGRDGLQPGEILSSLDSDENDDSILVTADVVDDFAIEVILDVLASKYKVNEENIIGLEAVVVPNDIDVEKSNEIITDFCYDVVSSNSENQEKPETILSIDSLVKTFKKRLGITLNSNTGTFEDLFGNKIKADGLYTLSGKLVNNVSYRSFNGGSKVKQLSTIAFNINLFDVDDEDTKLGYVKKLQPMIVVNSSNNSLPTPYFYLTGLSLLPGIFTSRVLKSLLVSKDIGPMNFLLEAKKSKPGEIISFRDNKATPDLIAEFINRTVVQDSRDRTIPYMVAIDVRKGDETDTFMYAFRKLHSTDGKIAAKANSDILDMCDILTGEEMPNLEVGETFIVLPTGHYKDKTGERFDTSNIDENFIINNLKDLDILQKYIATNLGDDECYDLYKTDAYSLRLEIYDYIAHKLNLDLTIDSRIYRTIVNPEFLDALNEATRKAGLRPDFNPGDIINISNGRLREYSKFAGRSLSHSTGYTMTGGDDRRGRLNIRDTSTRYYRYGR